MKRRVFERELKALELNELRIAHEESIATEFDLYKNVSGKMYGTKVKLMLNLPMKKTCTLTDGVIP